MSTDVFVEDAAVEWQDLGAGVRRKILGYNGTMMMVRVAFETGAFDVTIDGRTRRFGTGDGCMVPPNVVHGVVALEPGVLLDVFTPIREGFLA